MDKLTFTEADSQRYDDLVIKECFSTATPEEIDELDKLQNLRREIYWRDHPEEKAHYDAQSAKWSELLRLLEESNNLREASAGERGEALRGQTSGILS